jgi:hypothetical protein
MSWSVGAKGEHSEVRATIAKQFADSGPCAEPEEAIRQAAAKIIDAALEAQGYLPNVDVSAYGSMSIDYTSKKIANSLNIIITPRS